MTASQTRTAPQPPASFARRVFKAFTATLNNATEMQNRIDHYS